MQINEIVTNVADDELVHESKMVWAKKGNKLARKFRCSIGPRKGRVVSSLSQCSAPVNLKKRFTLRRTKAIKGARMTRKAKRTKRLNPTSKLVRRMNK